MKTLVSIVVLISVCSFFFCKNDEQVAKKDVQITKEVSVKDSKLIQQDIPTAKDAKLDTEVKK
jgi:hypothetical protein